MSDDLVQFQISCPVHTRETCFVSRNACFASPESIWESDADSEVHHRTIEGCFNESMVASVVSFIDYYRPKYALLENVKGMAMGGEHKNVLAAVLCAIVAMGYQVRTYALGESSIRFHIIPFGHISFPIGCQSLSTEPCSLRHTLRSVISVST